MFARALFPTDLSAYADSVLACLPDLKTAGLLEVVLLSVIRPSDVPLPETINKSSLDYWRWTLEEKLNIAEMALKGKGLRAWSRIEYGNPVEQILRVAEDEGVNLIVMGAQGATAAQELLIGSTAYEVVRRSNTPVLLQKFEVIRELGHIQCRQLCENIFKRVLHPTDFSPNAEEAFQLIKRLKAAGTEEVILLHVQDERVMKQRNLAQLAEFDRHDTERLEELGKTLQMFGLQVRIMLRHGIPFKEALIVADELDPCLIVLGSQGQSALREILIGSTLENLIRLSRQTVLVVRSRRRKDNERYL
ncbi:MAG: universal stress protein [Anaerolineales bacterium]